MCFTFASHDPCPGPIHSRNASELSTMDIIYLSNDLQIARRLQYWVLTLLLHLRLKGVATRRFKRQCPTCLHITSLFTNVSISIHHTINLFISVVRTYYLSTMNHDVQLAFNITECAVITSKYYNSLSYH